MNKFEDLGSVNVFAEREGLDPKTPEVFSRYTENLSERRRTLLSTIGQEAVQAPELNLPAQNADDTQHVSHVQV